jgi:hypothetical protein
MNSFWLGLFIGMPIGAIVWGVIRRFLRHELGGNWIGF